MYQSMVKKVLILVVLLALETVRSFFIASVGRMDSLIGRVASSSSRLQYMDSKAVEGGAISVALGSSLLNSSPIKVNSAKKSDHVVPTKVGVLLLNLGGPETMDDVEGFLYNLFADPDIIRLPSLLSFMQKPIAYVIAKRRAPKSSAAYRSIGGGSPIVKYTEAQANLIQASLRKNGLKDAQCYFAMRYWNPYTEDVLEQMKRDGVNSMVILPLYPQYSISTSGAYVEVLGILFLSITQGEHSFFSFSVFISSHYTVLSFLVHT
jgi:Ferrochelatase